MSGPSRLGRVLVGVGIVLFALNLRVAVGSVGVVLEAVRSDLGMSATTASLLTTLPLLSFAVVGLVSGKIIRMVGLHRTAVLVLLVIAVGLVARALADGSVSFLLATTLALCGAAVGNVILPPLVKANFPDRVALMSALYGAAVMGGVTIASVLTVPMADSFGSWRAGLGAWALLAMLVILPWVRSLARDLHVDPTPGALSTAALVRSKTMWALAACFGFQSAHAYAQFGWLPAILVDAGVDDTHAGLMLGLVTGVGIPLTLTLPLMIRWLPAILLPVLFGAATSAGWLGLLLAPANTTWLWSVLLGIGGVAFTWTLTMIGRRARTPEGVAALSAATQGIGYLIAGIGPLGAGLMHEATGSWDLPLTVFAAGSVLITGFGIAVTRAAILEDEIAAHGEGLTRRARRSVV